MLAGKPTLVAEKSLAVFPVASLDVNPQFELVPLKVAVLAPQLGGAVRLLLVENQQPPRPELLAAVLKDAGALEDFAVAGCGLVGVGSLLQLHQWRKFARHPRVIPADVGPAANLLCVDLLTVWAGLKCNIQISLLF